VTRLRSIRLGDAALERVVTNVTPTANDAGVSGEIMGLVGGEVLRRFKIFVDYPRLQLFLEPNARFGEPFEFDMSGMSLAAQGANLNEYRVRSLISGSPATEAGVAAGDILTAIDGRATMRMTLWDVRQLFGQPDREFALEMKRGKQQRQIKLRTRRLI
jgi:S1-C subfamily serine protease